MSILRDIIDMKDIAGKDLELKNNQRGSAARESNAGVLQFPILVTSALSLEEVTTISKALEREYVSFVAIMTSMDSVSDDKSIKSYIRKIHQNVGDNVLVSDSANIFAYRDIEFINKINVLGEAQNSALLLMEQYNAIKEDQIVTPYAELNETSKLIADKILIAMKRNGHKIYKANVLDECVTVKNLENNKYSQIFFVTDMNESLVNVIETELVLDEKSKFDKNLASNRAINENCKLLEKYESGLVMDILNDKFTPKSYAIVGGGMYGKKYNMLGESTITHDLSEADLVNTIANPGEFKQSARVADDRTDSNVTKDILRDNDVKKANELAPTLLHLKTYFKDADDSLHPVDYMIGVKTVVHKVSSQSMMDNVVKSVKRGRAFFNLMRLTTGEITFFKDYVFAVSRIKEDINSKFRDNPWFNVLTRKRKYSKLLSALNLQQQLVPNTTIVLTMDEVVKIKAEHSIDVQNVKTAKEIINQLFLMGIVIVDSSTEVSYFLFDGRSGYEQYSFNSLEKENSNSSKEIKNIMQVLGRM